MKTKQTNRSHKGLRELADVIVRPLNYLQKIVVIRRGSGGLEERKCHVYPQEGQEKRIWGTTGTSLSPQSPAAKIH